jgi:hypothetical protein
VGEGGQRVLSEVANGREIRDPRRYELSQQHRGEALCGGVEPTLLGTRDGADGRDPLLMGESVQKGGELVHLDRGFA